MLNDILSSALPTHWHRHLKLCLGLNFQLIDFQLPEFWRVEVKKRIDFHRQKNCSNFYFLKYEPYEKIINVNFISFTEVYHNIFFLFPKLRVSSFTVTSRVWTIPSSIFEPKCPYYIHRLSININLCKICGVKSRVS